MVNNQACRLSNEANEKGVRLLSYAVSRDALNPRGTLRIDITGSIVSDLTVCRIEAWLEGEQ